jgi:hypothetical protein
MIKLYTTKEMLGGGLVVASTDKDEADDIEGYFCTVEKLKELVEAVKLSIQVYQIGYDFCDYSSDFDFDQWLASKEAENE